MIYGIYVIHDKKVGFLQPTVDMNDNSAIRNFRFACANKDSLMNFEKSDFSLYKLGTFSVEDGSIVVFPVKELIFDGLQVGD